MRVPNYVQNENSSVLLSLLFIFVYNAKQRTTCSASYCYILDIGLVSPAKVDNQRMITGLNLATRNHLAPLKDFVQKSSQSPVN